MKAIIAAAGAGKRMRPLTDRKPKPMLTVQDKPLLAHIIDALPEAIDEVILIVGYKREQIQEYFGDSYGDRNVRYVIQEQPTGSADALLLCKPFIAPDERFLLSWADDLHDAGSIARCLEYRHSCLVAVAEDPTRFGVVEHDENGRILSIEEKPERPKSNLVNCGVYVLDGSILSYEPSLVQGERHFTGMLQAFTKDRHVQAVTSAHWLPMGFPEDIENAEAILAARANDTKQ